MTHMNNIQHASGYPGFLLAGLLDWVAMFVELPPGLQQVGEKGRKVVPNEGLSL